MYYIAKTVTDGVFVAGGTIATVGSVGETIITAPTGVGALAGGVATPAAISFTAKGIYNFSNDLEKVFSSKGADTEGSGNAGKMIGSDGVQVTSKTLWKEKGSSARIDVENPNPGQRPGQIHYQDEEGTKYLFDQEKKFFVDKNGNVAPKSVNDNLKNPDFMKKLNEGLEKYLGENGIE